MMKPNTLEFVSIFQQKLDQKMMQDATSGWMEANATQVKYTGGDTVKMPTIELDGLADYDRVGGYTAGSVSLKFEDYKLTQDRGRAFQLDIRDVDETGFIASAANVVATFQKEHVVPEVDAYRYSKIAALAKAAGNETAAFTPTVENVLEQLDKDIAAVQDVVGDSLQFVIAMPMSTRAILSKASGVQHMLDVGDFKAGEFNNRVKLYNGIPIITVPSARMQTAYKFNDGVTSGQEKGGFEKDTTAKAINWIVMLQSAPIAVSKTDTLRIFDPMTNQQATAWRIDYRKFHDVWVPKHRLAGVWVNTGA